MSAKNAVISSCAKYRYRLNRRDLALGERQILFVMLNPSTADADVDDPTIRRCVGFARTLGYAHLDVVNLYALRATDPRQIAHTALEQGDPVGPDNDHYINEAGYEADTIVCAWGATKLSLPRIEPVLALLPRPLYCLGVTMLGSPKHPLYISAKAPLQVWKTDR